MDTERIQQLVEQECPEYPPVIEKGPGAELLLDLPVECLVPVIAALAQDADFHHLTALTGSQVEGRLELLYHLWLDDGLTLRLALEPSQPVAPSISHLLPVALWYEREVHEMLGVDFSGHPNLRHLLLPEDWTGPPPMREEADS